MWKDFIRNIVLILQTTFLWIFQLFIQTIFEAEWFYNLFLEVSQVLWIRTVGIQIGKNDWELEKLEEPTF